MQRFAAELGTAIETQFFKPVPAVSSDSDFYGLNGKLQERARLEFEADRHDG